MNSTNSGQSYSLSIGRLIKAPIAAVFDAWLDAAQLQRWMAADGREGARHGAYRLIDRPNRLSFAWSSGPAEPDTIVDISLLASADGATMLLLKHEGLKSRAAEEEHREGWRRILDRMAETLKTGA